MTEDLGKMQSLQFVNNFTDGLNSINASKRCQESINLD